MRELPSFILVHPVWYLVIAIYPVRLSLSITLKYLKGELRYVINTYMYLDMIQSNENDFQFPS